MKLSLCNRLCLSLASHAVPVAIKAATVSRFSVVDRSDPCGAGGIAVGVIWFGPSATVIGGQWGDRWRGGAVAVIPPVLSVIVASFRVQAARMRGQIGGRGENEKDRGGEVKQLRHQKSHLG